MKLANKELIPFLHGAVRTVDKKDGFLALYRFTEKQVEFYKELVHPKKTLFFEKAHASSNIRIAFNTNASFFSFDYYATRAASREYYYYDVFVDGSLVHHQGEENVRIGAGTIRVELPEGEHQVTVYCPPLFSTAVANFTLSDGATISPVTKKRRMLILGDSITQGYDARFSSQSYANLLADKLDAISVNQGIGGETFNPGMLDFDLGFTPDIVTVAYGSNDFTKCTKEEMIYNANEFYRRLREAYPNAKFFSVLPIWRIDCVKTYAMRFEEAIEISREAALKAGSVPIEGLKIVPNMREFFADAKVLHPNELGFNFYANGMYNVIKEYLDEN
ncbi:MAG: SGNH/GDSL hydrolase family protein [Clostridia bacterium]|nr:SGNH/GDSL hydrolase family protein [Clostridia bacterium]